MVAGTGLERKNWHSMMCGCKIISALYYLCNMRLNAKCFARIATGDGALRRPLKVRLDDESYMFQFTYIANSETSKIELGRLNLYP